MYLCIYVCTLFIMQNKFELALEAPHVQECLEKTALRLYKSWRNNCRSHYNTFGRGECGRANPPDEFNREQRLPNWVWLCNLFDDPDWQVSTEGFNRYK
jgi:hypothetical protein